MARVPSQVSSFAFSCFAHIHNDLGNEFLDTVTITSQLVIQGQSIGVATTVCYVACSSESIFSHSLFTVDWIYRFRWDFRVSFWLFLRNFH
jgi:hypothetical protein